MERELMWVCSIATEKFRKTVTHKHKEQMT